MSKNITPDTYREKDYDPENLLNSEFIISGKYRSFLLPPITSFAFENLFYVQSFGIFDYDKGSYTRRSNFSSFLILYTYSGKGVVEYNEKRIILEEEDGIFIDCKKIHYYEALEKWEVGVLHIRGGILPVLYEQYENYENFAFHESVTGRFHRYLEQLLSIYDSPSLNRDLRASHCIDGMIVHLMTLAAKINIPAGEIPQNVQKAMKYMEDNFSQHITLDTLSLLTNTNKFHLSKEFKKYTGFSPGDYLITLRINRAKILLKTTSLPAIKISYEVGIHDINNFNYHFKNKVGMTPIGYRNSSEFIV